MTDRLSSQVETKGIGHRPEGGINKASRELGVERNDAHRAVKVAGLSSEAKDAAREVGLDDNRSALLTAARAEASQQVSHRQTPWVVIANDVAESAT